MVNLHSSHWQCDEQMKISQHNIWNGLITITAFGNNAIL